MCRAAQLISWRVWRRPPNSCALKCPSSPSPPCHSGGKKVDDLHPLALPPTLRWVCQAQWKGIGLSSPLSSVILKKKKPQQMEDGLLDEEFFTTERRLSEVWQTWKTQLIRRPSEARLKEPQKLTRRPQETRLKECRFCTHPDPYQQPHTWPIAVKLLTNHAQLEHTGFEGISPLCPPLPGKAIKLCYFIQNCLQDSIWYCCTEAEFGASISLLRLFSH